MYLLQKHIVGELKVAKLGCLLLIRVLGQYIDNRAGIITEVCELLLILHLLIISDATGPLLSTLKHHWRVITGEVWRSWTPLKVSVSSVGC